MFYVIFVVLVLYSLLLFSFAICITKLPQKFLTVSDFASFSIIIPYHNEESRITRLLKSLSHLNYNRNLYEIIFVNDHSTDATTQKILESKLQNCICINSIGFGKKNAMFEGLKLSKNKYVIFVDADTTVKKDFLQGWNLFIQNNSDKKFFFGNVFLNKNNAFTFFQQLEFAALQATGIASAQLKKAVVGSATNMCVEKDFLKTIFSKIKFDIPSGDDMFLLFEAKKKDSNVIAWNYLYSASVHTTGEKSFIKFLKQRIRWLGKSKFYNDIATIFTGLLVFLANASIIFPFFLEKFPDVFLFLFFIKVLSEFSLLFVYKIFVYKSLKINFLSFLPFAFLYPFYVVILFPLSVLFFRKQ